MAKLRHRLYRSALQGRQSHDPRIRHSVPQRRNHAESHTDSRHDGISRSAGDGGSRSEGADQVARSHLSAAFPQYLDPTAATGGSLGEATMAKLRMGMI